MDGGDASHNRRRIPLVAAISPLTPPPITTTSYISGCPRSWNAKLAELADLNNLCVLCGLRVQCVPSSCLPENPEHTVARGRAHDAPARMGRRPAHPKI